MRSRLLIFLLFCGLSVAGVSLCAAHDEPQLSRPADDALVAPPPPRDPLHKATSSNTPEKLGVLAGYCVMIVLGSLAGGYLPTIVRLGHNRMQTIISFVGGLMLGIGVFHMLPHAFHETGNIESTAMWMMGGMLLMFFLLRTFHFHQHDVVVEEDHAQPAQLAHTCGHDHDHDHPHAHKLSWVGITIGLSLHTLIDGLALGDAIEADSHHDTFLSLFGFGIFLAILLHKPLDALSITSLMTAGGWSKTARNLVNFGFALMCPLGALAFVLGIDHLSDNQHLIVGGALAAAAGVFICIALSDLLPEMEFHSHNRLRLSLALVAGVVLAWGIGFLEPGHTHEGHGHTAEVRKFLLE